jgi:hypothetical protein
MAVGPSESKEFKVRTRNNYELSFNSKRREV